MPIVNRIVHHYYPSIPGFQSLAEPVEALAGPLLQLGHQLLLLFLILAAHDRCDRLHEVLDGVDGLVRLGPLQVVPAGQVEFVGKEPEMNILH